MVKLNLKSLLWMFLSFLCMCSSTLAEEIKIFKEGGVYHLPVKINQSIELNFIIDTGASTVHIPIDVALTLMRAGTISDSDFLGEQSYKTADGSIVENMRFNLRNIRIGEKSIHNVEASVGSIESPLLLGQNVLAKLEPWHLSTSRGVFVFGESFAPQPPEKQDNNAVNPEAESVELKVAFINSPGDGFLALRTSPSTAKGQIISKIPHLSQVHLNECIYISSNSRWCKVSYAGVIGWVSARYLDELDFPTKNGWILQVASFTDRERAKKMEQQIKHSGFKAFVEKALINNAVYYRVCLGPEKERQDIESLSLFVREKMGLTGDIREYE
ncbi:retroviral-like aspartic protease family protein [Allochromatium humboldtianum]|uniref:Retroviral-like aspartic protease family protein n=1 Tax=Allochromatium humboldtianum TaxID=504901 RepID=A0A850RBU3_9GAMM|nr:retroviral-like aspartic protease family protein [Allochromatium humboldtianum]NVZ08722.1 retroviral-like aspartic protease family protein [Allochromatium humboldtianum]